MSDHDSVPRPPAMASPPSAEETAPDAGSKGVFRNTHDAPDRGPDASPEPDREELTGRDFAGAGNFAADQRRQRDERGQGLGAGSQANRDARHPAQGEGDVPVDDMD